MTSLVYQAKQGNGDAFVLLLQQYQSSLYKIAKSYLRDEEDTADALQETFLSAFEHLKDLRSEEYFRTWITRILINKCKDILMERGQSVLVEEVPERAAVDKSQEQVEFFQLLDLLPKRYRMIFLLYYGEEYSVAETAEVLGVSQNTVKTWLRRGRLLLRKALDA